jgi:HAD superfamily hydrolase (TIGR01509 family)
VIKALIFDFDGLIMDTESPEVDAWRTIYAEYGQEFPVRRWVREVVGSSVANFDPAAHLASLMARTGPSSGEVPDLSALRARALTFRLETQATAGPMPGVLEYVQDARRLGLRLAVASSSRREWVESYLRQLGLREFFEVLKSRENVKCVKPDPELFLAALAALGVRAEQALVFEDSPNGVLAGNRAGIRVVAVPNPITAQVEIRGADFLLHSLADLPLETLLARLNSTP